MSPLPTRVVILGGSGFLGRTLGAEMTRHGGTEVVECSSTRLDLTRSDAGERLAGFVTPDTALILASAITPGKGQNLDSFKANIEMVANVARFLERQPVAHFTFVSSDAVYGFDANPVTEETPVAPAGYYALAKYAGEHVLDYALAGGKSPLLVLRLTALYGPGDPHGSYGPNAFARSIARARSVRLFGDGEETRDHLYVDDAARLIRGLVASGATGLFNVATGESRSFADAVKAIRDVVPYEFAVTSVPRKGPITHRAYDTTPLRRAMPGFQFRSFEEGLRATLRGFGALDGA